MAIVAIGQKDLSLVGLSPADVYEVRAGELYLSMATAGPMSKPRVFAIPPSSQIAFGAVG